MDWTSFGAGVCVTSLLVVMIFCILWLSESDDF